MPPKKRIDPTKDHGYIGEKKYKAKPRAPIETPPWLVQYFIDRDRVIYKMCDEESKQQIKEKYKV